MRAYLSGSRTVISLLTLEPVLQFVDHLLLAPGVCNLPMSTSVEVTFKPAGKEGERRSVRRRSHGDHCQKWRVLATAVSIQGFRVQIVQAENRYIHLLWCVLSIVVDLNPTATCRGTRWQLNTDTRTLIYHKLEPSLCIRVW